MATSPRSALIATVREQLALARSAARTTLANAESAHWRARTALESARTRLAEQEPRLAVARANRLAAAHTGYARRRTELTELLATAVGSAAPGAAATPWPDWVATPTPRGTEPGLYRIGTLCGYDLPALVPLLDRAHLTVCDGSASATDGLVAGLLLRAIGSAAPGAVQVRVYDPQRLGRGLAGFAALAGAGLLRNVRPDGLDEVLDDLAAQIHRITGQTLAGEYPSLHALAEATGHRPEPWRIAVLLAPPPRPAQAEQLAAIARAGVACGVHLITKDLALPEATTIHFGRTVTTSLTGPLPVALDPAPPARLVTALCRDLAAPAVFDGVVLPDGR
jgi:hypothetical protein